MLLEGEEVNLNCAELSVRGRSGGLCSAEKNIIEGDKFGGCALQR